jgi:iron complex transport system ATP-binding protein
MVKVTNLTDAILENISFELADNENLIILGENGAGKSTLAKYLCAIKEHDTITLYDQNLHQLKSHERAKLINYIPPKLEIFDEYITLYEYLELSAISPKMSVDDVIEVLGIAHLKDKSCKTLSSGEAQLMLLSSAILHQAKITIFDEPTSNLDSSHIIEVYKLLKSDYFNARIVITHDLNLAYRLGYKILYIKKGEIAFFDQNRLFFQENNLNNFFGNSVKKIDDYFVVNL